MIFEYNKKFKKDKYKNINRRFEVELTDYIKKEFHMLNLQTMKIQLELSNYLIRAIEGKAIPEENRIILDYSKFSHVIGLKRRNKIWNETILKNNEYVYSTLHHELQHLRNNLELKHLFDKIQNSNTCTFIKTAIIKFIDEFIATFESRKRYNVDMGSREEAIKLLQDIIENKNNYQSDEIMFAFFLLVDTVSYAIAESICYPVAALDIKFDEITSKISNRWFYEVKNLLKEYPDINFINHIDLLINMLTEFAEKANVDIQYWHQFDKDCLEYNI
ncbi:MAG: hypothetical protein WBL93_04475 [Lutisporaceae bacterium]